MKERIAALLSLAIVFAAQAFASSSRAPDGYTLILVPDRFHTLQIGRDLQENYSALMVSYEFPGNPADPFLHAWHQNQWVQIQAESFRTGGFLQTRPARTIVVGDDNAQTRALIDTASSWCPQVLNAPAAKPAEMLNAIGKILDFDRGDYRYFARRHGLEVEDINAAKSNQSWYDQPREQALSGVSPRLSEALAPESPAPSPSEAVPAPFVPAPQRAPRVTPPPAVPERKPSPVRPAPPLPEIKPVIPPAPLPDVRAVPPAPPAEIKPPPAVLEPLPPPPPVVETPKAAPVVPPPAPPAVEIPEVKPLPPPPAPVSTLPTLTPISPARPSDE